MRTAAATTKTGSGDQRRFREWGWRQGSSIPLVKLAAGLTASRRSALRMPLRIAAVTGAVIHTARLVLVMVVAIAADQAGVIMAVDMRFRVVMERTVRASIEVSLEVGMD